VHGVPPTCLRENAQASPRFQGEASFGGGRDPQVTAPKPMIAQTGSSPLAPGLPTSLGNRWPPPSFHAVRCFGRHCSVPYARVCLRQPRPLRRSGSCVGWSVGSAR